MKIGYLNFRVKNQQDFLGSQRESNLLTIALCRCFKNYIKFNNTITAINKIVNCQMK